MRLSSCDIKRFVLLQAAADHLEQRIGQYNPQNVCNILWTYATLGYYPGGSPLDVAADYALHALEVRSCAVACLWYLSKVTWLVNTDCLAGSADAAWVKACAWC